MQEPLGVQGEAPDLTHAGVPDGLGSASHLGLRRQRRQRQEPKEPHRRPGPAEPRPGSESGALRAAQPRPRYPGALALGAIARQVFAPHTSQVRGAGEQPRLHCPASARGSLSGQLRPAARHRASSPPRPLTSPLPSPGRGGAGASRAARAPSRRSAASQPRAAGISARAPGTPGSSVVQPALLAFFIFPMYENHR